MKKLFALFILIISGFIVQAQNLVLNGSLEDTVSCPTTIGQIVKAQFWYNPTGSSPDYLHQCSAGAALGYFGYQQPHFGNAYSAIALGVYDTIGTGTIYREYIEGTLNAPLVAGTCYYFEMYANLAHVNYTTDDIGVYFSDTLISFPTTGSNLMFTPQIVNATGNFLDTLNWTLVSGEYEALGGETYFIIGNFLTNIASTFVTVDNTICCDVAQCYIDDVKLIPTVCTAISENNENITVSVYPNPAIDQIRIDVDSNEKLEVVFYDILSQKIVLQSFIKSVSLQVDSLSKGVYLYEISNKNGTVKSGKIIIL